MDLEFSYIQEKLASFTHTFEGNKLAKNLAPSYNSLEVQSLLDETTGALDLIHENGAFPISPISDVSIYLKTLESGLSLTCKGLLEMANILSTSLALHEYFENSEVKSLAPYFSSLYINKDLKNKISTAILSEDIIFDEASSKLASIRKNKKNLEADIKAKLNAIIHSSSYSKYIMDPVVTIRDNRFVIPVKEEYKNAVKGFIHDTSASGSTVYIEPMSVFEVNNKVNNLAIEETKEIEAILQNLSALLMPLVSNLRNNVEVIATLDLISAKANLALETNSTKPAISNEVNLINARHPLIAAEKVVPNTIYIGKDFTTLVITGPNTGGKTVALKTVGLLCLMAQSGLYIPAFEGSKIKVFDNIFADIGDEQSIEASLSTFSSHMTKIINIVNNVTENSLVLVDELGSGTDPIEGANLAISLLEYFHSKKSFTIATTHYHEIKNYCITHDGYENASCEFDIEKLEPTYHLLMGIPGKSNAFAISKRLGLPASILDRANSLMEKSDTDIETLMKEIYDNKLEIEKLKIEEEKNLNQAQTLRKSLDGQVSNKLASEQLKVEKAKKEAREILANAKEEANSIIKELNNTSDLKKANELRNTLNKDMKKLSSDEVDLSVLLKLNNQQTTKPQAESQVHINNMKSMDTASEINLIGETVDIAVQELDKYLDNCRLAHLHQVRVIHGKGTGKLREGIHQYLKTSKYVKSFRIADYGEGDYGVTIVELA